VQEIGDDTLLISGTDQDSVVMTGKHIFLLLLFQKQGDKDVYDPIGKQQYIQTCENLIEKTGHARDPPYDHMVPGFMIKITEAKSLRIDEFRSAGRTGWP
jgi:hypothetical protein